MRTVTLPEDIVRSSDTREHTRALLLYILLIAVLYSPVVFAGKSLMPSLYTPHGVEPAGVYGQAGRVPVNTFNVDIATPAYYEFPINRLVGNMYKSGELPLWNPYQGAGTPLAAQYSTRAFFPYQVLEDISPVWLWDFFTLGRLLVAGFFTYLFLSSSGLSFAPSFIGGLFYMFSGMFVWFINLEQMTNVAMMLPVVMWAIERMARLSESVRSAWRDVAVSGVVLSLLLLAGQPEVALYSSALAVLYFIFRSLVTGGVAILPIQALRFALSYLLALAIASPLIVPFLELVNRSFHIHHAGGPVGSGSLIVTKSILALLNPSATELPVSPSTSSAMVAMNDTFFRFLPLNGIWDSLGGYTGILPVFLVAAGLFTVLKRTGGGGEGAQDPAPQRGPLLFFTAFAAVMVLKHLGVRPFLWIGSLPLFDQVWSLRWSGPSWVFAVSAAAAIALQSISASMVQKRVLYAFFLVAGLYLVVPFAMALKMTRAASAYFEPSVAAFIVPSVLMASVVALVILACALVVFLSSSKIEGKFNGMAALWVIVSLGALELWWAVPRGYEPAWLLYKLLPFAIGLVGAALLMLGKKGAAIAAGLAFFVSFLALDTLSPRGFPVRDDPFREAPYVEFIRSRVGSDRVMGAYGALFPNYASALGIQDVRYVNSLMTTEYHDFSIQRLHAEYVEEDPVSRLWFTGRPERKSAGHAGSFSPIEDDIVVRLKEYSLLGVKYFIMPKVGAPGSYPDARPLDNYLDPAGDPVFPLVYDKEVRVYENRFALDRAYVAYSLTGASSYTEAQEKVSTPGFDPRRVVVLEDTEGLKIGTKAPAGEGRAKIIDYGTNRVTVEVETDKQGVLVLTDTYYPGWSATVNGLSAAVMRANGLVRGVAVDKGRSLVEFRYSPPWFRTAVALSGCAILLSLVLIVWGRGGGKGRE